MNALAPVGTQQDRLSAVMSHALAPAGALELRDLRYFAAAARTGNLGRAARELNVTAPAISQQLRKLEDELGLQLLIRHSRGVTPTPAGACLLERLDTILHLLNAPLAPAATGAAPAGTITLAVPAEIASLLAAPVLEHVLRQWPQVTLNLREGGAGGLESWLLDHQADIAVVQDPPDLDALRIEPLLTEALGLVAAPRAPLARSSLPLRLRDIAGVKLILPNPRHWIRRSLARAGFQRGLRFEAAFQVDSLAMTKEMVRNGLGCAVLPASAVRDETGRGTLVFRPLEQPALATLHAVAWRRAAAPLAGQVAAAVGSVVRSLIASGAWPGAQPVRSRPQPACPDAAPDVPPGLWQPGPVEAVEAGMELIAAE